MQQVLESGSVILSLAYNVTASPWPIATSRLMLTLALVEMNGRDCRRIQFPCEWQRQHFMRLRPTWRMAERDRPKFLVRHREWENMVRVCVCVTAARQRKGNSGHTDQLS